MFGKKPCKEFSPQCALLNKLKYAAAWRKSLDSSKSKTVSSPLTMFDGDAVTFVNRIAAKSGTEPFLNSTVFQQSMITPYVRLYKMVYDSKGKKHELEFKFATRHSDASIDSIFANQGALGRGVGLTSANIEYAGQNYEEADKLIRVNLSFFAESVKDVFAPPIAPDAARFSDLITIPKSEKQTKTLMMKSNVSCEKIAADQLRIPHMYQLKMVYGWSVPRKNMKEFPPEVKKAIENCKMTMSMTLYNYRFTFNPEGTLKIDAQYIASLMTDLDQLNTDIFGLDANMKKYSKNLDSAVTSGLVSKTTADGIRSLRDRFVRQSLENDALGLSQEAKSSLAAGNLDAAGSTGAGLEQNLNMILRRDMGTYLQKSSLESIIKNLEAKGAIYFWDVTADDISDYNKITCISNDASFFKSLEAAFLGVENSNGAEDAPDGGQVSFQGANSTGIHASVSKYLGEKKTDLGPVFQAGDFSNLSSELDSAEGTVRSVPIVFLCDLVDAILKNIQGSYPYKEHKYRVILGPMMVTDPYTKKRISVNIGDLPIPISDLAVWYKQMVVGQGLQVLPFNYFMKTLIKDLIINSLLNRCNVELRNVLGSDSFRLGFMQMSVAGEGSSGNDPLEQIKNNRVEINEFRSTMYGPNVFVDPKKKKAGKMYNYLIYYAQNQAAYALNGDPINDMKLGVKHLTLGKDRGLVKTISFKTIQNPTMKKYLLMSRSSPLAQLRLPFNADIKMIGNNYFLPGSYVYINPSIAGLGDPRNPNSAANKIGLGGYYIVIKVIHKLDLAKGNYETTLSTMWNAWPQNCNKPVVIKTTPHPGAAERDRARTDAVARTDDGEVFLTDDQVRGITNRTLAQRQKELQRNKVTDPTKWMTIAGVPYPVTTEGQIPPELLGIEPGEATDFDSYEDWEQNYLGDVHWKSGSIEYGTPEYVVAPVRPNVPPPPVVPARYRSTTGTYASMPAKVGPIFTSAAFSGEHLGQQIIIYLEATRPRSGVTLLPLNLDTLLQENGYTLDSRSHIQNHAPDLTSVTIFLLGQFVSRDRGVGFGNIYSGYSDDGPDRHTHAAMARHSYTFYCYKNPLFGWFIYYNTSSGSPHGSTFTQDYTGG